MADYYFQLPAFTQLTIPQQAALDEPGQIALSGGPGTGKSIVSVWRHVRNHSEGRNSLLLTYTHSLKMFLRRCCTMAGVKTAARHVEQSQSGVQSSGGYDEVIIDEAQDLSPDFHESLKSQGQAVSFSADDSQILYKDHCTTYATLRSIFPDNTECVLDRNFRCTQNIMLFARKAFPGIIIDNNTIAGLANNPGPLPAVLPYTYLNILRIVKEFASETHNVGILIQWSKDVVDIYDFLQKNGIDCSHYTNEASSGNDIEMKNVHVTTYRSAKGMEFDTVILPDFEYFYNLVFPLPDPDYSTAISEEDLYVAVTRARSNLFLLNNNTTDVFRARFDGLTQ